MSDQNTALLRTKLFVARPQANLVRRERAAELMNALPHRTLTLISAPPGFGKTTLISAWVERNGYPAAWVSLDQGDNDVVSFLRYVIEAIDAVLPGVGAAARAMMLMTPVPPPPTVLSTLINDIVGVADGFVLVLDDYHLISNPTVHEALLFLLDHAPKQLHCVITTRVDPPIPLARFRVRGQLLEVRAADLRFSVGETAAFLNQSMGLQLTDENLERLQQKTEGWIAGLQMAGLSLRDRDDVDAFIDAFTGADRYIIDFLLEEVIRRQPDDIQQAMLMLSILGRFTASLAEALTGYADGVALLEQLERANLFLISLDNRREWYRYHHLFGDLLQHRLKTRVSDVADLHRRAATWFGNHGLMLEAVDHARRSNDPELLASMLERYWRELPGASTETVAVLMAPIASERVESSPKLLLMRAWYHAINAEVDLAEQCALQADAVLAAAGQPDDDPESRELRGQIAAVRCIAARDRSENERVFALAEQALAMIPERTPGDLAYSWLTAHGLFHSLMGDAYNSSGELRRAVASYDRALAYGRRVNDHRTVYIALVNIARQQLRLGELTSSLLLLQQGDDLVNSTGGLMRPTALQDELRANAYYTRGDFDNAVRFAEQSRQLFTANRPTALLQINRLMFDIAVARNAWADAQAVLAESEGVALPSASSRFASLVDQMRVVRDMHVGNLENVAAWMEQYFGAAQHMMQPRKFFMRIDETVLHARALMALGRFPEAELVLAELANLSGRLELVPTRIRVDVLMALLAVARDDEDTALAHLEDALELASPEHVIAPFMEIGPELQRLLAQYRRRARRRRGVSQGLVADVAAACGLEIPAGAAAADRGDGEIIPLTNRELEILALMAQGLSNRQIAEKIYVSPNTVKTHVANLMDKLESGNRVEALARARELGMLEV